MVLQGTNLDMSPRSAILTQGSNDCVTIDEFINIAYELQKANEKWVHSP